MQVEGAELKVSRSNKTLGILCRPSSSSTPAVQRHARKATGTLVGGDAFKGQPRPLWWHHGRSSSKWVWGEWGAQRLFLQGGWLGNRWAGRAWRAVCAVIGRADLPACTDLPGCPPCTAAPRQQRRRRQRCTCQTAPRSPSCGESGHSGEAERNYNTSLGADAAPPGGRPGRYRLAVINRL